MALAHCEHRRIDGAAVMHRLEVVGLSGEDAVLIGKLLQQHVIRPHVDPIIEGFLAALLQLEQFRRIVDGSTNVDRLRQTLTRYLLTLGVDFASREYFEERLRVGAVHNRLGVPQNVYHSAVRTLQSELIRHIPATLRDDGERFEAMLDFILKITSLDLSLAVEAYCHHQVLGLEDSLRSERGESERLRRLAITDWLTDLHNHSYTRTLLDGALGHTHEKGTPLSVIMADLDQFKHVNDTHGHLVGDHVLRIVAARMISAARANDEIGRYGGEEFLFVLHDTAIDSAAEVAERVRAHIAGDEIHHRNASIRISLSLGVAQARQEDTVDTLIERADAALYAAKLAGRNRVFLEPAAGGSERIEA
jgi:diguanylate cyclase (GGDEF)-like protein